MLLVINYINAHSDAAGEAEATVSAVASDVTDGSRDFSAAWNIDAPTSGSGGDTFGNSARDLVLAEDAPPDLVVLPAVDDRNSDRTEVIAGRVRPGSSDLDVDAWDAFALEAIWGELVDALAAEW
jgi:hypothetical protein